MLRTILRSVSIMTLISLCLIVGSQMTGQMFNIQGPQLIYEGLDQRFYLFDLQTAYTLLVSDELTEIVIPETVKRLDNGHKIAFLIMDRSATSRLTNGAMVGEIYTLDLRTKVLTPLKIGDFPKRELVWSPDGQWLAFTDSEAHYIYLSDMAGNVRQLTPARANYRELALSPDGKTIVANRTDYDTRLAFISVEIGEVTQLNIKLDYETGALWSPEGRHLAFTARTSLNEKNIFVYDLENQVLQQLASPDGDAGDPVWSPIWSPDGRRLAFTLRVAKNYESFTTVGVTDIDGGNFETIPLDNGSTSFPSFSPDGRWIAVATYNANFDKQISLLPADNLQAPLIHVSVIDGSLSFLWR